MSQADLWGPDVAARYDTPGEGMFADEVLGPTVDCLEELAAAGPVLEFAIGTGDMATARIQGAFSLVYLVFNTISNLLTHDEQICCFENAARHLAPGGRFVIELWVPQLVQPAPGRSAAVFAVESGYVGLDTYDTLNQRVVSHHFSIR